MKGLDLSQSYYLEYGRPMLEKDFPELLDKIAIGFIGHGSECFGYDDDISKDHDFEPGFSIWLDEDTYQKYGFKLFRAYEKLPKEYMGIRIKEKNIFGSNYLGVHKIKDFYSFYLPNGEVPKTNDEWLRIDDFYLAEATNGKLFLDTYGEFSEIRNKLLNDRPNDVRLKKLASSIFYMAQNGQYNYERCIEHGENIAAAISLAKFIENTAKAVYLLNNKYAPYYKWIFKGMKDLPILSDLTASFELLMENPYDKEKNIKVIDSICLKVEEEIRRQGLSERHEPYIEPYAYCILNNIKDNNLRNSDVMM